MATRKNTFLVRRSNVAGNVPTAGQLLLGELALNTADVKLYTSGTTTNSILPIGWDRISRTGDTMTGSFSAPTISATTYYNLPNDLPSGGSTGQILAKIDSTNYNTEWIDNYTSQLKHIVKAGEAISKGQAVYVSSADGTNMIVSKASNASEATSSKTLGLLDQSLSNNGQGFVITEGLLTGLNTLGANAGDPVWLGTSGNLIYGLANKPYAPAHLVFIGIVTRVNSSNGEIFVKVQNGFELDELHDVDLKTTTPINGHILGYNGTLWVNKTIAGWLGFTPANDANVLHTSGNESASGVKTFSDTTQSTSISSGAVIVSGGVGITKNLYVGGNLNLGGNLNIGGTLTTINAQNLSVSDNMIYLNNGIQTTITNAVGNGSTVIYTTQETHNYLSGMTVSISGIDPTAYNLTNQIIISVSTNSFTISNSATGSYVSGGIARAKTSANPDLGFAGGYNDGSYAHTGLFRDATDNVWKFFKGYTPEPDASPYIDTSDPSFAYADLRAFNITSNSFIKVGGTSSQFLKADGSIDSTTYVPSNRTLGINGTTYDLSANRSWDIPVVTANTFNNGTYDLTISTSNGTNYTSNLGLLMNDVNVTGGTYNINTGIVTFTNSTGGTFTVSGFSSGMTDTFVTGGTYSNGTATFTRNNNASFNVTGFNTGTVTGVNTGNGMDFSNFTTSGTITLGTPSNTTLSSTNAVTTNSHTHAFAPGGTTAQYITGAGTLVTFPTIPTVNDGTLSMATSGIATGSASFTANQSGNSTFTVNVPATDLSIGSSTSTVVRVDSSTGTDATLPVATSTLAGVLKAADWSTFNGKQAALNGTGFIKANGTTISYDNTSYLPLVGGTLTGALYGTVGSFSQSTAGDTLTGYHGGTGGKGINGSAANGIGGYFVNNSTTYPVIKLLGLGSTRLIEGRDNTDAITFAVTSAGAVSGSSFIRTGGTSAQFLKADGSVDSNPYTTNLGTVTSVAALTLGTTGTDLSSSVANGSTTPVITLNVPTASASNRGALSSTDWSTFNGKQAALNGTGFIKANGTTISYDNSTYVPTSRTITINGTTLDLSANRSWTVSVTETDTLATVTSRGNSSTGDITVNGELLVKSAILNNQSNNVPVGTTAVFSRTLGTTTAAFFDYVVASGANARAGSIMVVVNGSSVEYTETSTNDIGSTTSLNFAVVLSGGNLVLNATSSSGTWTVKVLGRLL